MQTAANNHLIFTDVSSSERLADLNAAISYGGFYQLVRTSLVSGAFYKEHFYRELGERLVVLAEHAHAFRRMDMVEDISQMLVSLPLPRRYEAVGQYYQALCVHKFGIGNILRAMHLLEGVADKAPPQYRLRAIQSLAGNFCRKGDYQIALSIYKEASNFAARNRLYDPYATIGTQKMVAVLIGLDGNHRDAVALLEALFPMAHTVRSTQPHLYYDYLNSLAVELSEVGRLEEAANISQIVLASPFAPAYPEWSETNDEIALKDRRASRSVVAFTQWNSEIENQVTSEAGNLVQLVAPQRSFAPSPRDSVVTRTKHRASVVNLLEWKNEVTERKTALRDRQTRLKELKKLPTEDKIAEIWGRLGDEEVDDDLLCEALLILEDYQPEENQGS